MSQNQDFDIVKLIELSRHKKYESTIAGFGAIDKLERIAIPKKKCDLERLLFKHCMRFLRI
jgi:hypothetical protein